MSIEQSKLALVKIMANIAANLCDDPTCTNCNGFRDMLKVPADAKINLPQFYAGQRIKIKCADNTYKSGTVVKVEVMDTPNLIRDMLRDGIDPQTVTVTADILPGVHILANNSGEVVITLESGPDDNIDLNDLKEVMK